MSFRSNEEGAEKALAYSPTRLFTGEHKRLHADSAPVYLDLLRECELDSLFAQGHFLGASTLCELDLVVA